MRRHLVDLRPVQAMRQLPAESHNASEDVAACLPSLMRGLLAVAARWTTLSRDPTLEALEVGFLGDSGVEGHQSAWVEHTDRTQVDAQDTWGVLGERRAGRKYRRQPGHVGFALAPQSRQGGPR